MSKRFRVNRRHQADPDLSYDAQIKRKQLISYHMNVSTGYLLALERAKQLRYGGFALTCVWSGSRIQSAPHTGPQKVPKSQYNQGMNVLCRP